MLLFVGFLLDEYLWILLFLMFYCIYKCFYCVLCAHGSGLMLKVFDLVFPEQIGVLIVCIYARWIVSDFDRE